MQRAADEYEARTGQPMPGAAAGQLGYAWTVRDCVHMRDAASGHEPTPQEAEAAAARRIEALRDADSARAWLEDTRHQRAGRTSMADLVSGDC